MITLIWTIAMGVGAAAIAASVYSLFAERNRFGRKHSSANSPQL